MDFLLKAEQIVVEAKMTRAGIGAREISEQLIIDVAKYREHPDCKALVCGVYDPAGVVRILAVSNGTSLDCLAMAWRSYASLHRKLNSPSCLRLLMDSPWPTAHDVIG